MADKAATLPETVRFRSSHKGLQVYVPHTGARTQDRDGRWSDRPDYLIRFRDYVYTASRLKQFRITDPFEVDKHDKPLVTVTNEVDWMLKSQQLKENGGIGGTWFCVERGDESARDVFLKACSSRTRTTDGTVGEPLPAAELMRYARAAVAAERKAEQRHGPKVTVGIQALVLPQIQEEPDVGTLEDALDIRASAQAAPGNVGEALGHVFDSLPDM